MLLNLSHIGQIGMAVSDVDRAEGSAPRTGWPCARVTSSCVLCALAGLCAIAATLPMSNLSSWRAHQKSALRPLRNEAWRNADGT